MKSMKKLSNFIEYTTLCPKNVLFSYQHQQLKKKKRIVMANLHHCITHKIIFKSFELQLKNWGKINE